MNLVLLIELFHFSANKTGNDPCDGNVIENRNDETPKKKVRADTSGN